MVLDDVSIERCDRREETLDDIASQLDVMLRTVQYTNGVTGGDRIKAPAGRDIVEDTVSLFSGLVSLVTFEQQENKKKTKKRFV